MTPFLQLVANDLYQKLGGDFQNTTIIFPNKRASLFFDQYLWENAGGKTIWTPEYTTISELFASLAEVTVADPILLTVKLFEVYQQEMKPTKTLDQLYSLMETMLSDFQDIDNNLVEPSKLFLNIADLKELTDFSFLEPEQRAAIEQFFGRFFDHADPNTPLKTQFRTLWNHLTTIYNAFRHTLLHPTDGSEPIAYEGMLKRMVVETLTGTDNEQRQRMESRLASHTYVMVGFNVLNKTELALFRHIKLIRDAKFYWDYDMAYTRKAGGTLLNKYEAGQFINDNIAKLGDELRGMPLFDNMRQPKHIDFIQSPTEDAQTRYIHQWLGTHLRPDEPLQQSAVVLCNERLLQPVLHSIGSLPAINITMGYPLEATPTFSLIQALLDLQSHGRTRFGTWRHKYALAVLKHPFIQKINMTNEEILTSVSGKELIAYLTNILAQVGQCYQDTYDSRDLTQQIHKESIFVAYTALNRIRLLQQDGHSALAVGDDTLGRILLQLLRQASIPFHGEPAVGLQVMGLLETRNLDFCNVIMLSVNEGQLPKGDKRTSLIPYTLRAAYGMTTIEKEVSLYAYYYYRLLQRADDITILYNSSTEGGCKGEMSRFMLQTLVERDTLLAPGQTIQRHAFTAPADADEPTPFCIRKDETVMAQLRQRFTGERILSPSALNTYQKCPLQFYLSYVAGLRPEQEVTDEMDRPMFGTIFHQTMQTLYTPFVGRPLHSDELTALANNTDLITQHLDAAFTHVLQDPLHQRKGRLHLNGTLLINRHVLRQFVVRQVAADAAVAAQLEGEGGYLQFVSQETQYQTQEASEQVTLGGIIDRLDLLHSPQGDRIRIVDYKTSSSAHAAKTLADLFDREKCTQNYHITQILYYAHVLTSASSPYAHTAVSPALMYPATDLTKHPSGIVRLTPPEGSKKEDITDFAQQYGADFAARLTELLHEIFTPYAENEPDAPCGHFNQCTDPQHCAYCDFLTFCRRHPQQMK